MKLQVQKLTLVCMIWPGVVENSLNWEAEDKGFIPESATY